MTRDADASESLEVIDLSSEGPVDAPRSRSRSGLTVGALVLAGVAALLVTSVVVTHDHAHRPARASAAHIPTTIDPTSNTGNPRPPTQRSVPIKLPRGPILGRFYPVLDNTDSTSFVLPSGRALTLSGGLTNLIGGLGATFDGSVTTGAPLCCSVRFQIFHAAPSDLFATPTAGAVSALSVVTPATAKIGVDGLRGGQYRYGILSAGDWTLIAHLLDARQIVETRRWRLRSTPEGAVLSLPADSTVTYESVTLGRTPDLTDREIVLTENSCPIEATKAQTLGEYATNASWCQHGLLAQIDGPESYIRDAVADLKVNVAPIASRGAQFSSRSSISSPARSSRTASWNAMTSASNSGVGTERRTRSRRGAVVVVVALDG